LLDTIRAKKPRTIVEVGTWNGLRALEMLRCARQYSRSVSYVGYDLFEGATAETDAAEFNVKPHCTKDSVDALFRDFRRSISGVKHTLIEGNTRDTLHGKDALAGLKRPIMAFIDGGHSVETIRGDYLALKGADVLVFDDFYTKDDKGLCPDTTKFGCNKIFTEASLEGVMAGADPVRGGGLVALAIYPADAFAGKVQLKVNTRNCVPDQNIRANVSYAVNLLSDFLQPCDAHDGVAIFCSAGPSLEKHIEELRELAKSPDNYILCVKHSHDKLIAAGIVPWACILLDPRSHVQDFIENPHPGVIYLTATMVHPSTIDRLQERKAKILAYNALVGAREETVLPSKAYLINGGTTSAVRGISVLHFLGFKKFRLYGYDSCYTEPKNRKELTKVGQQMHYQVTASGRTFWTSAELIAQVQDMEKLLSVAPHLDIEVFGDGLLQHTVRSRQQSVIMNRDFEATYGRNAA